MAQLSKTVSFRVSPDEKEIWDTYCRTKGRSQNDLFRDHIIQVDKQLKRLAKKNPPLVAQEE